MLRHRSTLGIALLLTALASSAAGAAGPRPPRDAQPKDGIGYRIVPGPGGARVPQLTRGPKGTPIAEVNRQLKETFATFVCGDVPGSRKTSYAVASRVELAERGILSVFVSLDYYCGGPYPDVRTASMTIDLVTGREVPFAELFADYERDRWEILRTIFARQVEHAAQPPASDAQAEDCEHDRSTYTRESLEATPMVYHCARDGVHVEPDFAHMLNACEERVTIPYGALRRWAKPGGILERMARRAG